MQDPAPCQAVVRAVFFSLDATPSWSRDCLFSEMLCHHPLAVTGDWLQHVHDEVVHLVEHHKVNGQTRSTVLRGRVTRQPGEGVVLLQHISVKVEVDKIFFNLVVIGQN